MIPTGKQTNAGGNWATLLCPTTVDKHEPSLIGFDYSNTTSGTSILPPFLTRISLSSRVGQFLVASVETTRAYPRLSPPCSPTFPRLRQHIPPSTVRARTLTTYQTLPW